MNGLDVSQSSAPGTPQSNGATGGGRSAAAGLSPLGVSMPPLTLSHLVPASPTISPSPSFSGSPASQPAPPAPARSLGGLWVPDLDATVGSLTPLASKREVKDWPVLALQALRLDGASGMLRAQTERLRISHSSTHSLTVQHLAAWRSSSASVAPPFTLRLDGKPHRFRTGVGATATELRITARQLDASEGHAMLVRVQFPPVDKYGAQLSKFASFAEEQVAAHRAGYMVERTFLSDDGRTLTQLVEYRRAPANIKSDKLAAMDAEHLPVLYTVKRVYTRDEESTPDARMDASGLMRDSSGGSVLTHRASSRASPSSMVTTPLSLTPARHFGSVRDSSAASSVGSMPASPMLSASPARSPTSALSSPTSAASSVSGPIPYCTLSGTWRIDRSRSDTLDGMMKELNVGWVARKVILSLDVTTRIDHEPASHVCVITDTSSAGEQATKHDTRGEWNEVTTKEGKTIRMLAREGDEMRSVWGDLPAAMLDAPLAWTPSPAPFTFPSHLPVPFSPALKLHPLQGGYLWIHSLLPDVAGGEMSDVRVLIDRTQMMQQTIIIKNKQAVHTTTRYFNKVETEEERMAGEEEWERKIEQWKARQMHAQGGSPSGYSTPSSEYGLSRSSSASHLHVRSPSNVLLSGFGSGGGPNPDLSGSWRVVKDRSNDLTVLLRRMGVGFWHRTFASGDIRTTITHDANALTLHDRSKFGRHTVSYVTSGSWMPVSQYGSTRQGLARVLSDPVAGTLTIETCFFEPARGRRAQVQPQQAQGARQQSGTASPQTSSPFASPLPPPSLLTQESSSPLLSARSVSVSAGALPPLIPELAAAAAAAAPDAPLSLDTPAATEESKESVETQIEAAASSSTAAATEQPASSDSASEQKEHTDVASLSAATPPPPRMHVRTESGVSVSGPSTPLLAPTPSFGSPIGHGSLSVRPPSVSPSPSPLLTPSLPTLPGQVCTSRLLDVRQLQREMGKGGVERVLMRQVMTYLEREVAVCVCSRLYERDTSSSSKRAAEDMKKKPDRRDDERDEAGDDEDAADIGRSFFSSSERRRDDSGSGAGGRKSGKGLGGGSSAPAGNTRSVLHAHSQAHAPHLHAAPVSVVLPSASADVAAASVSGVALHHPPPAHVAPVPAATLTPPRVALLLLLLVALVSGHSVLLLLSLAALAGYAYSQLTPAQQSAVQASMMAHYTSLATAVKSKLQPNMPVAQSVQVQ